MQNSFGDPYSQECRRGPWIRQKVMGKGAFGSVTLWKNEETKEMLCIKQCHAMDLSDRHKDQWQKECMIMLRLSHPNVVKGLQTPKALDPGPSTLPVLAIEYCEGGDLRKVLNKSENSCGLPELQVRAITKDTSLAVEYLHSKKIVHRDLKPENIVLKPLGENKFQYKLIDLGYAKDISAGSICKSFVGTEQYLAPELFMSVSIPEKGYSNNVDYWCLGTTVFECIVGFRPFFHGVPAVQWLQYVSNKKQEHICGIFNLDNDVIFSSNIPSPNYLCRYSADAFEQWLRLMLMYDANNRGGGIKNNRPVCFEQLELILSTKVLHIYHVLDNRVLSYPVHHQKLGVILENVRRDIKISIPKEVVLTVKGEQLSDDISADLCCGSQDEESNVILIPEAPYKFAYRRRTEPELVRYIFYQKSKETCIPFDILKRGYSHFVFYYRELNHDYQRLLQALKAISMHVLNKKRELMKENNAMFTNLIKLQTAMCFFRQSIALDIELFQHINLSDDKLLNYWIRTREEVGKFDLMQEDVQKQREQCTHLDHTIDNVIKTLSGNENFGKQWEEEVIKLYEQIRKTRKEARVKQVHDNSEIIKCTTEFLQACDQHMINAYSQIQTILEYKAKLTELTPHLIRTQDKLKQAHEKINAFQKQRQADIWSIIKKLSQSQTVGRSGTTIYTHDTSGTSDAHTFAIPDVPPLPTVIPTMQQASMSSLRSNSSMIIENSTMESVSLRNESLSNIKRIKQLVTSVQESLRHPPVIPNWSDLDQDSDIMAE